MFTLVMVAVGAALLFLVFLSAIVAVKMFYKVPVADEAFVKTGGSQPVISIGQGLWIVPIYHRLARVSLRAVKIPINRTGDDSVPTADKLMAEIHGELFVRVAPDNPQHVLLAAQTLGEIDPESVDREIQQKIDSLVTDALRTAAFKKTFLELNSQKKEFAEEIVALLQEDLNKLGLTLTAVTIPNIKQGNFSADNGDVLAAEGRRNVAEATARARQETNQITRSAEVKVQEQDVQAARRRLELELERKRLEADQQRQITEYEQDQQTQTTKAVLSQEQGRAVADAEQKKAVATAEINQTREIEEAKIQRSKTLAIQKANADAEQKKAEEAATQARMTAEIARQRAIETATIEKEQAVETANIHKDQTLKVADEARLQAVAEAEVGKQVAIATKKAEEAAARAAQAKAESEQRSAEEAVVTVKAAAEADRTRQVTLINAQQEAERQKIAADRDAYVQAKKAEGDRDAALKQAEAAKAAADGRAQALRAEAAGTADASIADAKGKADARLILAAAQEESATKESAARISLAKAALEEGKSAAESIRLRVEAENQLSSQLMARDVALATVEKAPDMIREFMQPITAVSDVKIIQVNGLGGGGEEGTSVPSAILGAGMAASGVLPIVRSMFDSLKSNPEVQAVVQEATAVAKKTLFDQSSGNGKGI